jgi:hypothetical protein
MQACFGVYKNSPLKVIFWEWIPTKWIPSSRFFFCAIPSMLYWLFMLLAFIVGGHFVPVSGFRKMVVEIIIVVYAVTKSPVRYAWNFAIVFGLAWFAGLVWTTYLFYHYKHFYRGKIPSRAETDEMTFAFDSAAPILGIAPFAFGLFLLGLDSYQYMK